MSTSCGVFSWWQYLDDGAITIVSYCSYVFVCFSFLTGQTIVWHAEPAVMPRNIILAVVFKESRLSWCLILSEVFDSLQRNSLERRVLFYKNYWKPFDLLDALSRWTLRQSKDFQPYAPYFILKRYGNEESESLSLGFTTEADQINYYWGRIIFSLAAFIPMMVLKTLWMIGSWCVVQSLFSVGYPLKIIFDVFAKLMGGNQYTALWEKAARQEGRFKGVFYGLLYLLKVPGKIIQTWLQSGLYMLGECLGTWGMEILSVYSQVHALVFSLCYRVLELLFRGMALVATPLVWLGDQLFSTSKVLYQPIV